MKKLSTVLIAIILFTACGEKKGSDHTISGTLENAPKNGVVYFEKLSMTGVEPLDTSEISESGEFAFDHDIKEKGYYRVKINDPNSFNLILAPGEKVTITGDASNLMTTYDVTGSAESKRLKKYNEKFQSYKVVRDSLGRLYQTALGQQASPEKIQSLKNEYDVAFKGFYDYVTGIIEEQPSSFVNLTAISNLSPDTSLSYYVMVDEALAKEYEGSDYYKRFHDQVAKLKSFAMGSEAPEIELPTPEGETQKLSSLRGNIVLVDFWASWCKPCRQANPHVVSLYEKYKDQGFTVYSVSLDGLPKQQNPKQEWLRAIEQDNLSWDNHVSDLKGWSSPIVNVYNVKGIPMTFLLDEEGKIIGKNLRGEQLTKKLEKVFEEKEG